MGLSLMILLFLLIQTSLTLEDEEYTCTTMEKSALVVGTPSYTCSMMLEDLATACGKFISCAMNYSKPMCLCDACSVHYDAVDGYYNNITGYRERTNYTHEKECKDLLFSDDGVNAVENGYNLAKSLWTNASCHFCKNNSDEFYRLLDETLGCWEYYIVNSIPVSPANDPESHRSLLRENVYVGEVLNVNHTVCANCSEEYYILSSYYERTYSRHHSACADIKSHMEMTTIQWNKLFGCDKARKPKWDLQQIVAIAIGFAVLIVTFYGGVYLYGFCEEKKEKTIYTVHQDYESMDTSMDDPQNQAVVREQTAYHVPRTNIN